MKLPVTVLLLALTSAVFSAALSARPGWGVGPEHDDGMLFLDMVADEIGLTLEQEHAINTLIDEAQLASAVDRERLGQIRDALRGLSRSDGGFDSSGASVLAEEMAAIVSRLALSGSELRWNIRQVLTAGQREQLDNHRRGPRQPPFIFENHDPLSE